MIVKPKTNLYHIIFNTVSIVVLSDKLSKFAAEVTIYGDLSVTHPISGVAFRGSDNLVYAYFKPNMGIIGTVDAFRQNYIIEGKVHKLDIAGYDNMHRLFKRNGVLINRLFD